MGSTYHPVLSAVVLLENLAGECSGEDSFIERNCIGRNAGKKDSKQAHPGHNSPQKVPQTFNPFMTPRKLRLRTSRIHKLISDHAKESTPCSDVERRLSSPGLSPVCADSISSSNVECLNNNKEYCEQQIPLTEDTKSSELRKIPTRITRRQTIVEEELDQIEVNRFPKQFGSEKSTNGNKPEHSHRFDFELDACEVECLDRTMDYINHIPLIEVKDKSKPENKSTCSKRTPSRSVSRHSRDEEEQFRKNDTKAVFQTNKTCDNDSEPCDVRKMSSLKQNKHINSCSKSRSKRMQDEDSEEDKGFEEGEHHNEERSNLEHNKSENRARSRSIWIEVEDSEEDEIPHQLEKESNLKHGNQSKNRTRSRLIVDTDSESDERLQLEKKSESKPNNRSKSSSKRLQESNFEEQPLRNCAETTSKQENENIKEDDRLQGTPSKSILHKSQRANKNLLEQSKCKKLFAAIHKHNKLSNRVSSLGDTWNSHKRITTNLHNAEESDAEEPDDFQHQKSPEKRTRSVLQSVDNSISDFINTLHLNKSVLSGKSVHSDKPIERNIASLAAVDQQYINFTNLQKTVHLLNKRPSVRRKHKSAPTCLRTEEIPNNGNKMKRLYSFSQSEMESGSSGSSIVGIKKLPLKDATNGVGGLSTIRLPAATPVLPNSSVRHSSWKKTNSTNVEPIVKSPSLVAVTYQAKSLEQVLINVRRATGYADVSIQTSLPKMSLTSPTEHILEKSSSNSNLLHNNSGMDVSEKITEISTRARGKVDVSMQTTLPETNTNTTKNSTLQTSRTNNTNGMDLPEQTCLSKATPVRRISEKKRCKPYTGKSSLPLTNDTDLRRRIRTIPETAECSAQTSLLMMNGQLESRTVPKRDQGLVECSVQTSPPKQGDVNVRNPPSNPSSPDNSKPRPVRLVFDTSGTDSEEPRESIMQNELNPTEIEIEIVETADDMDMTQSESRGEILQVVPQSAEPLIDDNDTLTKRIPSEVQLNDTLAEFEVHSSNLHDEDLRNAKKSSRGRPTQSTKKISLLPEERASEVAQATPESTETQEINSLRSSLLDKDPRSPKKSFRDRPQRSTKKISELPEERANEMVQTTPQSTESPEICSLRSTLLDKDPKSPKKSDRVRPTQSTKKTSVLLEARPNEIVQETPQSTEPLAKSTTRRNNKSKPNQVQQSNSTAESVVDTVKKGRQRPSRTASMVSNAGNSRRGYSNLQQLFDTEYTLISGFGDTVNEENTTGLRRSTRKRTLVERRKIFIYDDSNVRKKKSKRKNTSNTSKDSEFKVPKSIQKSKTKSKKSPKANPKKSPSADPKKSLKSAPVVPSSSSSTSVSTLDKGDSAYSSMDTISQQCTSGLTNLHSRCIISSQTIVPPNPELLNELSTDGQQASTSRPLDVIPEIAQEASESNEAIAENSLEDLRDFTQALIERSRLFQETESTINMRTSSQSRTKNNASDSDSVCSTRSTRASSQTQRAIANSPHGEREIDSIFANINNVVVRVDCYRKGSTLRYEKTANPNVSRCYLLKNIRFHSGKISSGFLKIGFGACKPMEMPVKHCVMYKVESGKGLFTIQHKCKLLEKGDVFDVPLGTYYSIDNRSNTAELVLYFTKICSTTQR